MGVDTAKRASAEKTIAAAREPVARTIRLSFGGSGLRKGEQTIWKTGQVRWRVIRSTLAT